MKHELRIRKVPGQNAFRIVKQTHGREKFGKDECGFKAKNGLELYSAFSPRVYFGPIKYILFVRGYSHRRDNDLIYFDTPEQYRAIKQAVKEYNKWGRGQ